MVAVGDWKVAVIFSRDLIPMSVDASPQGLPAGETLASKELERIYMFQFRNNCADAISSEKEWVKKRRESVIRLLYYHVFLILSVFSVFSGEAVALSGFSECLTA